MQTRNMFRGILQHRAIDGHKAPAWATAVSRYKGNWYFEETPHQRPLDRFQLAGSGATRQYNHRTTTGYDYYYDLPPLAQVAPPVPAAPAVDEALPPAPESGLYVSGTGRRKLAVTLHRPKRDIFPNDEGHVQFKIDNVFSSVRISAETARDLASDLYRMARQLEKDNL